MLPWPQAEGKGGNGMENINIHFLNPSRMLVYGPALSNDSDEVVVCVEDDVANDVDDDHPVTPLHYKYRNGDTQHLPTKLAQYLADKFTQQIRVQKAEINGLCRR